MKRCDNCFESNSDGATNCVICGDTLAVPQVSQPSEPRVADEVEIELDVEEEPERAAEPVEVEVEVVEDFEEDTVKRPVVAEAPAPAPEPEPESAPAPQAEPQAAAPARPPPVPVVPGGTVVLQVFHDSEPRVVHVHPVVNDITLVGREDPQRDVFPDLDLGRLPSQEVSSDRASRQHLRLLRHGDRYYLYVYKGSTGTQVCDKMVDPSQYGKRFEISVGDRIILGGKVRMKLAQVQ
jgi:hypothetical protein